MQDPSLSIVVVPSWYTQHYPTMDEVFYGDLVIPSNLKKRRQELKVLQATTKRSKVSWTMFESYAVSISCQTNSGIILYESPCYKTVWNLKWIFCDRLIGNNRLVHPGIFLRRCATWQSRWGWSRPSLLPSLDPRCKPEIPKRSSRLPRLESHAKKSIATMHAFPSCPQTGILSLARSRWKRISISLWGSLPPLQRASLQKLRLRTGLGSANKIGYDTSCVIFSIIFSFDVCRNCPCLGGALRVFFAAQSQPCFHCPSPTQSQGLNFGVHLQCPWFFVKGTHAELKLCPSYPFFQVWHDCLECHYWHAPIFRSQACPLSQ